MNQAVTVREANSVIAESVIAKGDLAKLSPAERTEYYRAVCESVGLNPLTQPLAYITLNGKLTLYALKGATDQLRKIYRIAVTDMTEVERDGVIIVTVKVSDADGRTDMAKGAVSIGSLKGDALANAIMKAETKAKRRATLSICGLGMLDESEVETTNGVPEPRVPQRSSNRLKQEGGDDVFKSLTTQVGEAKTVPELQALHKQHAMTIASWPEDWRATFETEVYDPKLAELQEAAKHRKRPTLSRAASEPSATGGAETNGTTDTEATLSDADSALLLKSLTGIMGRIESRLALKSWAEDSQVRASINTLTETDKETLREFYDARKEALPAT